MPACEHSPLTRASDAVSVPPHMLLFAASIVALIVGPLLYLLSRAPSWLWTADEAAAAGGAVEAVHAYSSMAFLYHMFALFLALVAGMLAWERIAPREVPCVLVDRAAVDLTPWAGRRSVGLAILATTAVLYAVFW